MVKNMNGDANQLSHINDELLTSRPGSENQNLVLYSSWGILTLPLTHPDGTKFADISLKLGCLVIKWFKLLYYPFEGAVYLKSPSSDGMSTLRSPLFSGTKIIRFIMEM